jgi:transcriptional regulator with XRE-family HTH domain
MSAEANNPVRYFGRQVRKARLAAGWTLAEFGQRTGYDPAHLGRIENGKRPATKVLAQMCDRAFPERGGWFSEFYEESRTWIATPPWFRDWVDREQRVTPDDVNARVAARMKRQAILTRDDPPTAWFLLDEAALRRCVGSAEVMAAQMSQLVAVAGLPNVTIQVVPAIAHAGLVGGFALTESAAYVETAVAGQVFEDNEIIARLLTRFDTLRNEALRASESLAFIEQMGEEWQATGGKAATQQTTEGPA